MRSRVRGHKKTVACGLAGALVAGVLATTTFAGATTTVTPSTTPGIGADRLVRDDHINVDVSQGGFLYSRTAATPGTGSQINRDKYNYALPVTSGLGLGCRGDVTGADNTPKSETTVTGPGGAAVFSAISPAIKNDLAGALAGYPVSGTQTPSSTQYRGDVPPSGSNGATPPVYSTPARGLHYTVDLTGKPAGVYTVTTTTRNMLKTGLTACSIGTPDASATSPTGFAATSTAGPVVETQTFEYRPWQHVLKDVGGKGTISFNVDPAESQQTVDGHQGAIVPGGMHFYTLPGTTSFSLPSDPTACAANPGACLPLGATSCDPSAGCDPRVVIIDRHDGAGESLTAVVDLETGAFIAASKVGGHGRILLSLGTKGDSYYGTLISQLRTTLAAQGFDVDRILGLGVEINNGHNSTKLTLLDALQVDPSSAPGGVRILTDLGVQAGLLLNIFTQISPTACTTRTASAADGVNYAHDPNVQVGYTAEQSDFLIDAPTAAGLDALGVGGKVWHIKGDFQGPASNLLAPIRTNTVLAGVDASPGEAQPITAEALLTAPLKSATVRSIDFLGTANWLASETNLLGTCLTVDFMVGTGISINNNPTPLGWGNLPVWKSNPFWKSITTKINTAVASASSQVTTNPVVADLLGQILTLVPPITG